MTATKTIGLIENLFSRPKGLKQAYDQVTSVASTLGAQVGSVLSSMATNVVQGRQFTGDLAPNEMAYLRRILDELLSMQKGQPPVGRPSFRRVIEPGDPTLWWVPDNNGLFNGQTFTSLAGYPFTQTPPPLGPHLVFNRPASTSEPYFNFASHAGQVMTSEQFTFGQVKENYQIIQLDCTFIGPFASTTTENAGGGFGILNGPFSHPSTIGVWCQPRFFWQGFPPWGMTVTICYGTGTSNRAVFHLNNWDDGIGLRPFSPLAITITWNRSRIGISVENGPYHIPWRIPPAWWIWPWLPENWPFPYPYTGHHFIGEWGDPFVFPELVLSTVVPPPVGVSPAMTWTGPTLSINSGLLCRGIIVEEIPFYTNLIYPPATCLGINPRSLFVETPVIDVNPPVYLPPDV